MKIVDRIYHCQVPGAVFGIWQLQCHLRIFQPRLDVQTVMVTDMGFERSWFIPYLIEQLINQIVKEFHLDPAKLIWIEHYTPTFRKPSCPDFSQVTFDWQNGQAKNPQWRAITPEIVQAFTSEARVPV